MLSEREFLQAKASQVEEESSRKEAERSALNKKISQKKDETREKVRQKKSSSLQTRVAAAALKVCRIPPRPALPPSFDSFFSNSSVLRVVKVRA